MLLCLEDYPTGVFKGEHLARECSRFHGVSEIFPTGSGNSAMVCECDLAMADRLQCQVQLTIAAHRPSLESREAHPKRAEKRGSRDFVSSRRTSLCCLGKSTRQSVSVVK